MESFRELFIFAGEFGFFSLAAFLICLAVLIVFSLILKIPKKYFYTIFLSLPPIILGIIGTIIGRNRVEQAVLNNPGLYNQEAIDAGYEVAWASTELGIKLALPLIIIFLIFYFIKRSKYKNESNKQTERTIPKE